MEYTGIYHEQDKRYCFALKNGTFVVRIRTKKEDMKKVVLHWRDKYIPLHFADTRCCCEMQKVASDCFYDYYETVIEIDMICMRYYFELVDTAGVVSYFGNCEFYEKEIENIDFMFNCSQNLREEEVFDVPDWAKNKIVYQIFPSRYASSQQIEKELWYKAPIAARDDLKGDLRGIIEHFDHLIELGIEIVYLTPIFQSDSSHKYDTIDYYKIDPSFGTNEDLKELVELAHSHGMYVILDGVFNHTSPKFFAFADIAEKGRESKYWNWYYIEDYPLKAQLYEKPNFKTFAYYGGMPKLNLQNKETADYFINVGRYWVENYGIDGWRLDVADEIGHTFWKKFRKAIREVKKEVLLIGEVWYFARDFMEGDEWDTVMNYDFFFGIQKLIAQESISVSRFMETLGRLRGNLHCRVYPVLWNLIDSHDTARFLHICGENKEKLKMAAAFQLLLPGMPFLYYGDEYGMTGGEDPDCRRGMVWEEAYQDQEIYEWYRKWIRIRKEYPVITEGTVLSCVCEDEKGTIVLTRQLKKERAVILFDVKNNIVDVKVETVS